MNCEERRPVIGILCCNEVAGRAVQVVANRFIEPLAAIAGATVVLVPSLVEVTDSTAIAPLLDGLLLTGSRSNVAPSRYGASIIEDDAPADEQRDEVALRLAERMIEAGKPVFGICRGMQELNVLFGGTLVDGLARRGHRAGRSDDDCARLLAHRHDVVLTDGGILSRMAGSNRLTVSSVHQQGVERLGAGLSIEARAAHDDLVEAVAGGTCGADVLAVQWHPEWDVQHSAASRAFFARLGQSARNAAAASASHGRHAPLVHRGGGGRYLGH